MPVLPGAEPFELPVDAKPGPVGVLLVHGFTGCPQSLRPWGEYLAKNGLTVSAPRLPGHGTTWQECNLTRWTDWYAEAERAYLELREKCDTVFVFGLSMGATLTMRLAETHPEIPGIVLVNPSILSENKLFKIAMLMKALVPSVKAIGSDIKAPGVKELAYERTPVKAAASLPELWKAVRADLGKLRQPTLIFRSRADHVVEASNVPAILGTIGSKDVREVVLENSYHVATLDNDKETIFEGSLDFVRAYSTALAPAARTASVTRPTAARKSPPTKKPAAVKKAPTAAKKPAAKKPVAATKKAGTAKKPAVTKATAAKKPAAARRKAASS